MKRTYLLLIIAILSVLEADAQSKDNTINGHEYVDLGLSVKWAACNMGASSPSDYGDYYAWGELQPKRKYLKQNCTTHRKRMYKIGSNKEYDAARADWGGSWRLPTKKEIKELIKKCKWEETTLNGRKGYKVTGSNGNSIFLPVAGYRYDTALYFENEFGFLWGEIAEVRQAEDAYCLRFGPYPKDSLAVWNEKKQVAGWSYRHYGRSIRPVSK